MIKFSESYVLFLITSSYEIVILCARNLNLVFFLNRYKVDYTEIVFSWKVFNKYYMISL